MFLPPAEWSAAQPASASGGGRARRGKLALLGAVVLVVALATAGAYFTFLRQGGGSSAPQHGHWEGSKPDISFDVDDAGLVQHLSITGPLPAGSCTMTVKYGITVTDGAFDPGVSGFQVTGHFTSATTAEGSVKVTQCHSTGGNYTIVLAPIERAWKAQMTGAAPQGTATGAATPVATAAGPTPTRVASTPKLTPAPTPSPKRTYGTRELPFTLSAQSQAGNALGLVTSGEEVTIVASGRWCMGGTGETAECGGPEGIRLARADETDLILPSAPMGALIARIGGAPWFLVGNQANFKATSSGELILTFNDRACCYADNSGEIQGVALVTAP